MSNFPKEEDLKLCIAKKRGQFELACQGGYIDVMVEFLTSPDQEIFQKKLQYHNAWLVNSLSLNNSLEYLKFCLESKYVKYRIKVHSNNDNFFKVLCSLIKEKNDNRINIEILNYLVFDHKIKQTETIKHILKEYPDIKKLFSVRELNNKLSNGLLNKQENRIKVKI